MTELNTEPNTGAINGAAAQGMSCEAEVLPFPSAETDAAIPAAAPSVKRAARPVTTTGAASRNANGGKLRVADIRKNQPDCREETIDYVFFRRPDYAIYRSGGRIMVHYADDASVAKDQVANIADLLPLRDQLQYLVSDMNETGDKADPHSYQWQIAESLRLGLERQKDAAKSTLQAAIDEIGATRVRNGRIAYLHYAGKLVVATALLCAFGTAAHNVIDHIWPQTVVPGLDQLMMAIGSGAVGALFFTAIALRARTVATDGDVKSNKVDSTLRILIGVISAAVLYLILASNLFSDVTLGGMALGADAIAWQSTLLIGFVAGYLERLVPDLLEKKLAPATK